MAADTQGIFSKAITYLFGANWRSSTTGYITLLAYFIHDKPQVIQWIPEPAKGMVWNAAEWIFLGGFLAFAKSVKDRAVTGGIIQQTTSGAKADEGTQDLVDATVKATKESGEKVPKSLEPPA